MIFFEWLDRLEIQRGQLALSMCGGVVDLSIQLIQIENEDIFVIQYSKKSRNGSGHYMPIKVNTSFSSTVPFIRTHSNSSFHTST